MIKLFSTHLQGAGCQIYQAEADADRLIVTTACNNGDSEQESVFVGEDTDLLVLLAKPQTDIKMMIPTNRTHPEKYSAVRGFRVK